MLCDSFKNTAVIEFVEGKSIILKNEDFEIKALSNSSYKDSIKYLNSENLSKDFDPYMKNSLKRFKTAAECLKHIPEGMSYIDYSFEILKKVSREDTTWSAVYDIKNRKVHFFTKSSTEIKSITLDKIDFGNDSDSKLLILSKDLSGDVTDRFEKYSSEINKKLVYSFFKNKEIMKIMNIDIPNEMLEFLSGYPESLEI